MPSASPAPCHRIHHGAPSTLRESPPAPRWEEMGNSAAVLGRGPHLQFLLPLQGKLFEGLDDQASVGAVVDEYRRAAHPRLQVIYGQRDVLSVVLENKTQCTRDLRLLHRTAKHDKEGMTRWARRHGGLSHRSYMRSITAN